MVIDGKQPLREQLRARRKAFVDANGLAALRVHAIVIARIALTASNHAGSIAAYLSNGREVDAMPLIELACAHGVRTALPHVEGRGGAMRFLAWRPGDPLVAGPYGLPQPSTLAAEIEPDTIFTPLVGFDRLGNRLGQGGGFYDRAFARHPATRRIGLAWSVQEIDQVPTDEWDQPLHAIVTEHEWIRIEGR